MPCLITERSWLIFNLIGRDAAVWLVKSPEEWSDDANYTYMCSVATDMIVVNDCTERNIRAITDYIRFTRNVNGMLNDIILVGEDRRSLVPNMNREYLMNA